MRKVACMFALGFAVLCALNAQTARKNLFIGDLTGGAGSDGKNAAALLATQDIIRGNFTIVKTPEQADFVIGGEIRREGLGYTAQFAISKAAGTAALAEESLYYRDFLEIAAYMPAVAAALAGGASPDLLRELPPLAVPSAPKTAAAQTPVQPPAVKKPARPPAAKTAVTAQPPAGAPPVQANIDTWRNKHLYVGAWAAYEASNGFSAAGEVDWRPFKYGGLRIGLGTAHYVMKFNRESRWYNGSNESVNIYQSQKAANGLLYYFGARGNLPIFKTNLGLTFGGAFLDVELPGFDLPNSGVMDEQQIGTFGAYMGLDYEIKAGPGIAFLMFNGILAPGGNEKRHTYNGWAGEGIYMKDVFSWNLGLGYRFGLINRKTPWKK